VVNNLLNLALLGRRRNGESLRLLPNNGVSMRGLMLQSMHFEGFDLSGVDFARADLSNAAFSGCDLTEAQLDARLNNTLFEGELTMKTVARADFGLLGQFQSEVLNQQALDWETFRAFLVEASEEAARSQVPSATRLKNSGVLSVDIGTRMASPNETGITDGPSLRAVVGA
jgi:uncharacterized protein YjbI with pentapeptide repeats